ncbi:hypothetical protein AB0L40_23260 [Patulibacter sp. NPDC049589]|uniref:DUF7064 domain-containing protein n=1 Tax=Patulibacter sp. NPDC049589 TaxID=3154731 RepID=UPI00343F8DA4
MALTSTSTEHFARHALRPEAVARESFLFNVKLPELGLAGLVYTWVNADSVAGCAAWIYGGNPDGTAIFEISDGIPVPADQGFDRWTVGPLTASMRPGNEGTTAHFAGDRLEVELEFHPMHERYLYSEAPSGCPSYFADDRMEQSGRVTGRLRIDDREIPFEALGHHDHSWGTRDWGAVQHYKWLESQAEDTSVHVFDLQAYGERHLAGYVYQDGVRSEVRTADWKVTYDERWVQQTVELRVVDETGRETTVTGQTFSDIAFPVDPNATLVEAMVRAEVGGRPGTAYLDFLWPPDYIAHITATK